MTSLRLALYLAGILFATLATGCTMTLQEHAFAHEKLVPEGYLVGDDGSLAIVVRPVYFRPGGFPPSGEVEGAEIRYENVAGPTYVIVPSELVSELFAREAGADWFGPGSKPEPKPKAKPESKPREDPPPADSSTEPALAERGEPNSPRNPNFKFLPPNFGVGGGRVSIFSPAGSPDLRLVPTDFPSPGSTLRDLPPAFRGAEARFRDIETPLVREVDGEWLALALDAESISSGRWTFRIPLPLYIALGVPAFALDAVWFVPLLVFAVPVLIAENL